jgi:hypothetical protein
MEPTHTLRTPAPTFATDTVVRLHGFRGCRRIDLYDAWLFAQAEAELTYREWAGADVGDRRERHLVYQAALDREDQAAVVLAAALRTPAR